MWPNPCSGFSDQISAMSAGVLDTSLTCFPPEYPWSDRSSHQRCSVKKGVLREISSENSQENTCVKVAFLITFTAQKMKFFPVNVTKSAVSGGFGHIYWRNPYWKTSFFVQWSSATSKKVPQPEEKMSNRDQRKNVRRLKKRLKETKVKKTVQI